MAVVDIPRKTITLKIVYYGCALGGKTTNLQMLHKLTDPDNAQGMVSIATKDDRTLFFDLLPMQLGQIGGLMVKVKLYTVPGQVHYELTRRQVLAGADGVVLVVDSTASEKKSNAWALENLRYNLKAGGFDPDEVPLVLQWNKRDKPDARPVAELEAELNKAGVPTAEAVAVTGSGVVDTFSRVLKETIWTVYQKTGRTSVSRSAIDTVVDRALAQAVERQPDLEAKPTADVADSFDHRFDMEAYKDEQVEKGGRAREIVDESSLLAESVKTNMMLAERLDGYKQVETTGERRKSMMKALGTLAPQLTDASRSALPDGTLEGLLSGAGRRTGSLLFFKGQDEVMEVRKALPDGRDMLNDLVSEGLGSVAWRLSKESGLRVVEDLATEIFYGNVPANAQDVASALVAPLHCDGLAFGSVIVYARVSEGAFDDAEIEYWSTAARLIGLSLHWRALRRKVLQSQS